MNQLIYAQRNARAVKNLDAAIARLRARFELPDDVSAVSFAPRGADANTRRLLETEYLVTVLDAMATAPVRDDANFEGMPAVDTGPIPHHMPPTPRAETVEMSRVAMGFPDNPGMPVLHGPGSVNVDATGVRHGDHMLSEGHLIGLAQTANDQAAALADRRVERNVPENPDDTDAARIALANEQAAELGHAKTEAADDMPEGEVVGFADNPGMRALSTTQNIAAVDQEAVEREREKLAESAAEGAADLERERVERSGYTIDGEVLDHPMQVRDLPAFDGEPDNAGAAADMPGDVTDDNPDNAELLLKEADAVRERNEQRARARKESEPKASLDSMPLAPIQKRNLAKAGFASAAALRGASDDDLLAVNGIGPATVEHIRALLANGETDSEVAEKE